MDETRPRRAWRPLLIVAMLAGCSSAPKGEPHAGPETRPGSAQQLALPGEGKKAQAATARELPGQAPPAAAAQRVEGPPTAADPAAALAYDPNDPLSDAELEAADALDSAAAAPGDAKPPRGGCAIAHAGQRVWPEPGPARVVSLGRGFAVVGYARKGERDQLFLVHLPAVGLPEPITAFDVVPPHPRARVAPPGASARSENDLLVAFTDGESALFARRLRIGRGGTGPRIALATGVDARFSPAVLHHQDQTLVAWTLGTTPMQSHLAVLDESGAVLARHDVTPTSMGASAPTFVEGASPPVLLAMDARDGISPILRIALGADLLPKAGEVAVPVGMASSPAELAAAASSVGTRVAYTGMGSAATSAVGLVALDPIVGSPEPLVKGTAYGQLHVSAAAAPRALLFAADAPVEPGKDPPHEIRVHVVGIDGAGEPVVIRGPGGRAAHASIARDDAGQVAVAYTADSGVYVARLRCDDGEG